jgi:hypothetical protein
MIETLIALVVAILVFCLVWWLITLLPIPADAPPPLKYIKVLLLIILIIAAIIWLWQRFLA